MYCDASVAQFEFLSSLSLPVKRLGEESEGGACLDNLVELQVSLNFICYAIVFVHSSLKEILIYVHFMLGKGNSIKYIYNFSLQTIDDSVTAAVNKQIQTQRIKHLFDKKRFFLNREVPKEVLTVIIRSCGGDCSWDATSGPGSIYGQDDTRIDYQVVDRPMSQMNPNRYATRNNFIHSNHFFS